MIKTQNVAIGNCVKNIESNQISSNEVDGHISYLNILTGAQVQYAFNNCLASWNVVSFYFITDNEMQN